MKHMDKENGLGRVLLVAPAGDLTHILTPDLGIGYVAAALREAGYTVDFIDIKRDKVKPEELARRVKEKNYIMAGVKAFSPFLPEINEVIKTIKASSPDIKVVLGGPHPTYAREYALKSCHEADAGIIGEGEKPIVALAKAFCNGNDTSSIESIIYRNSDNEVKTNPPGSGFQDLEALPLPAWDLMDPRLYRSYENFWYFSKGKTTANISISRGCPFSCTFCSDFMNYGKSVRYRSLDRTIEEITMLKNDYGVDELHITDSIFTVNKKFVHRFCDTLVQKNLKMHWATIDGVRLDTLDSELLAAMEGAGCYGTSVGIESGSPRVLDFMKKGITKEKIEEKLNLIKETTDFLVQGLFIIGYPTETRESIEETIEFAARLPLHMAVFSPFRLTPGTEVAKYVEDNEPESTPDWSGQTMERIKYIPKGLTREELQKFHKKAYRTFYLRPHIAWQYLKMIKGPKQLRILTTKLKNRLIRSR